MSIMRLILIEDNHRLAESIRRSLEAEVFTVDRLRDPGGGPGCPGRVPYDLILLDLGMPDGDGVDLIASLRRSKVATPILIITARDGIGDRVRGLDCGADDYLVKPFATDGAGGPLSCATAPTRRHARDRVGGGQCPPRYGYAGGARRGP